MREMPPETELFGKDFLWSLVMRPLPNEGIQTTAERRA